MISAFIHFFASFNPIVFSLALFAGFAITLRRPVSLPLPRGSRPSQRLRRPS